MRQTLLGRRGRTALVVLGMLAGVVVVLIVYAVVVAAVNSTETNQRGQERESQVRANDEALQIIKDCTQPAGECFQRGQRRTARAVSDIAAGNILAVVCALQVPNGTPLDRAIEQVTACVADELAQRR